MNIQIGINKLDFSFSSNEVAYQGDLPAELEFADYLLLPAFAQPIENFATSLLGERWLAAPNSVQEETYQTVVEMPQQNLPGAQPQWTTQSKMQTDGLPELEDIFAGMGHSSQSLSTEMRPLKAMPEQFVQPLAKSVSQQTINAIENSLARSENQALQSITVAIHPKDLGQLNIQIELVADSIQAKIVASESWSAELLNRSKDELINSLSEFGYSQTEVDISHHHSDSQQQWEQDFDLQELFVDQSFSSETEKNANSVMLVGINMVA